MTHILLTEKRKKGKKEEGKKERRQKRNVNVFLG